MSKIIDQVKQTHCSQHIRPILEHASLNGHPSTTNYTKHNTAHNTALRGVTGCTLDTNIQHFHDETNLLSLHTHRFHTLDKHPTRPLHFLKKNNNKDTTKHIKTHNNDTHTPKTHAKHKHQTKLDTLSTTES